MSYKYGGKLSNGNHRYFITMDLYRDCFQSDVPLDDEIQVGVYLAGPSPQARYTVVTCDIKKKDEVIPPGSVDCDFYAQNICIEYGQYQGFVDLPPRNAGYDLVFERCCRNRQSNIPDDNGTPYQGQTYKCHIPSHVNENNSARFSGVPSPYMCAGDTTTFDFSALDPDGDELVYYLVHPYQGASITQAAPPPEDPLDPIEKVQYLGTNYSFQKPFGKFNGSITNINKTTGLATFMAPTAGSYVVAMEVAEIRDGDTISRVRMDLQILVLNCPPNKRPNISAPDGQAFTVEAGAEICFDVLANDPDDDYLRLTAQGVMLDGSNGFTGTRATFTPNNDYEEADGEFCWDTDCDHARDEPYVVTITVEDDGCPPKKNTIDITITVTPFVGADSIDGRRNVCRFNTYKYEAVGGKSTSSYEWQVTNGIIEGNDTGKQVLVRWDNAGTGTVTMTEISEHGCRGEPVSIDVQVVESPPTPTITGKDTVCVNEMNLFYTVNSQGNNVTWWMLGGTFTGGSGPTQIEITSYGVTGFTLFVTESNALGCVSDTAIKEVFVSDPLPALAGPVTVCPNAVDIVYAAPFNSGSSYAWSVSGGTKTGGGNTNEITVTWGDAGAGSVTVFETNRHGCVGNYTLNVSKTYNLNAVPIYGPSDVCEDELNVQYYTDPVNGSSFFWNVLGGMQTSGDSSEQITVDWGAPGPGSVSVQQRAYDLVNNRVCSSPVQTLNVTVHPKPTADEILGTMELCQYEDSVTYTLEGFPGSTYIWTVDGNNRFTGQGGKTIRVDWNETGSHTITVKEITAAGCENLIIDTVVLVNPAPQTSEIQGPAIVCPENALNNVYSVTGFPTSTFNWTVGGARNFTGQGTNTIIVNWEPTVPEGIISVVEVTDKGCTNGSKVLEVEIDRLAIDLRFVSVGTPDNRMIINWKLPEKSISSGFTVQKRIMGTTNWIDVIDLPGNVYQYTETDINTDNDAFEYRVIAENKCGTEISSEVHNNILLVGSQDENLNINVIFFDYGGWDNGVKQYVIYESNNNGPYAPLIFDPIPGDNTQVANDPSIYKKCYRIYATEYNGENTNSWSNEICFVFSPTIFVPKCIYAQ